MADKVKANNPRNCWKNHTFSMFFPLIIAIQIVLFGVSHLRSSTTTAEVSANFEISMYVQAVCLAISAIGFIIFMITPTMNAISNVFEDVDEFESYDKTLVSMIRAQMFVVFGLVVCLTLMNYNMLMQSSTNSIHFCLFFLSTMIDLIYTSEISHGKSRYKADLLQIFNVLLLGVIAFIANKMTVLFLLAFKIFNYFYQHKNAEFAESITESKTKKLLRKSNYLNVVAAMLTIFVLTDLLSCKNLFSQKMLDLIDKIIKTIVVGNFTKAVTYFIR